jgi:hypothetical protein
VLALAPLPSNYGYAEGKTDHIGEEKKVARRRE